MPGFFAFKFRRNTKVKPDDCRRKAPSVPRQLFLRKKFLAVRNVVGNRLLDLSLTGRQLDIIRFDQFV